MSSKILKFTPRPDNKLYVQGQELPVAKVIPISAKKESPSPTVQLLVTYSDYLKISPTPFTFKEDKVLNSLGFEWDEKYKAMYSKDDDGELVEKKGRFFFYLYVLPFNIYPCEYKVFKSLKDLVAFLGARNIGPGGFTG